MKQWMEYIGNPLTVYKLVIFKIVPAEAILVYLKGLLRFVQKGVSPNLKGTSGSYFRLSFTTLKTYNFNEKDDWIRGIFLNCGSNHKQQ